MREAIHVPWTPQEVSDCRVVTPETSGPLMTEPARSDTDGETPLSMTATITCWPWVIGQAAGACTMSRTHISWSRTASALAGLAGITVTAQVPAAISRPTSPPTIRVRTACPSTLALLDIEVAAGQLRCARPPSLRLRFPGLAFLPSRTDWRPHARVAGRQHSPRWRSPGRGRWPAAMTAGAAGCQTGPPGCAGKVPPARPDAVRARSARAAHAALRGR